MPPFQVRVGAQSVTGEYRDRNEDRYWVDLERALCLVADGMGGQSAGEQASGMAVEIIPRELRPTLDSGTEDPERVIGGIRRAIVATNREIMALSHLDRQYQNMGTTVVLALVRGANVYLAGIGDSRAYLIRGRTIKQYTVDHSVAEALVEAGTISRQQARGHPFRNMLCKYLGSKDVGDSPEVSVVSARSGDRFLLASDGLTNVVDDAQIRDTVRKQADPQRCADRLVEMAIDADTHDNVTCVLVYLG